MFLGRIHSDVRKRFEMGEDEVVEAMKKFANFTDLAKKAILNDNWIEFADLMDKNFDLRREIYKDECIGEKMLEAVEVARRFSSSAKFPGSGGAIVGLCYEANKIVSLQKYEQLLLDIN